MKFRCFFLSLLVWISCIQPSYSPPEEAKELLKLWEVPHGTAGGASPVVHEDKIIMSGGLFVYALKEETGEEIWKDQFEDDNILQGRLFLINGNQIAAAHIDKIRAWDISNGSLEWEFEYEENQIRPKLIGKNISFRNKYAFISENGNRFDYTSEISKPFIVDKTGGKEKTKNLDNAYRVTGLSYYEDQIFVSQSNTITGAKTVGRFTILDAQSLDSLWVYNTEKNGITQPIKIEDDVLYINKGGNSPEYSFLAMDTETKEILWEYNTHQYFCEYFITGPKRIFTKAGSSLTAFNKNTGNLEWTYSRISSTLVKPIYMEGYIYHSDHGSLFIIDAETGELVHEEPNPGGGYLWHLAVSKDKIFVQTSTKLFAFQPWHLRSDL